MFDASLGHSNGGAMSIVTRGGTNLLHGDIYLFKRWAALNANSWQNNKFGNPNPSVNYHQYGDFVSGPVYIPKLYDGLNHSFFSTSFEKDADVRDLSEQARVPTALERKGDFSQTLSRTGGPVTIYDPFGTQVVNGKAIRQSFAGNVIPSEKISPIGAAVLNSMPLPNLPGAPQIGAFTWFEDETYTVGQQEESVRIDHNSAAASASSAGSAT